MKPEKKLTKLKTLKGKPYITARKKFIEWAISERYTLQEIATMLGMKHRQQVHSILKK